MKVSPIQFNYNYKKINFCADKNCFSSQNSKYTTCEKGQIVNVRGGGVFNRHITEYCRADMNWVKLEQTIRKKFPNPQDANFIIYAASTGEEPYTMAILLDKIYTKPISIKAFDISQDVIDEDIKRQKEGVVIDIKDVRKIYETLNLNAFNSYFKADRLNGSIKLAKRITDCIEFKRSNILEDINKIDSSKPVVLMARNMWPYVHHSEYKAFCEKLKETLAPGSLFVIGVYDYNGETYFKNSGNFPYILSKSGFKPVSSSFLESFRNFNLIFEKK